MRRSRSGSSSTRRTSPVCMKSFALMSAAAGATATTSASAAAHPITQEGALHLQELVQLADRLVAFLLLVAHGTLPFRHLRLQYGRQILDGTGRAAAAGHVVEQLQRPLIVLGRGARQRI